MIACRRRWREQHAEADNAFVLVTHYQRLLNYIVPDYLHVMEAAHHQDWRKRACLELENRGYDWVVEEYRAGTQQKDTSTANVA